MSTTIFTAKEYDPQKERRRRHIIIAVISAVIILGGLAYLFRFWSYEHQVDKFFKALEKQDFKQAYGIWQNDPDWSQHPDRYKGYSFAEFYRDWGPSGEWGIIKNHQVEASCSPVQMSPGRCALTPWGGSGSVVVQVIVNGRLERAKIWMEKKDHTMGWPPY